MNSQAPHSGALQRYWAIGLMALCVIAYLPAGLAFFVKDDIYLATSARLDLVAALHHAWPGMFFRPAAELFFASEHSLFGLQPLPYHLVSFAAHLGVVFFAYRLFNLLPQYRPIGPIATALLALHPLNTETVGWVSGQMSLFAALCSMVVLFVQGSGRHLPLLVPIFVIGLGFYENYLLVLLLWGALWAVDTRFRPRPVFVLILGFCAAAYLYWRFAVLGLGGGTYEATLSLKAGLVNFAYYMYLLAGGSAVGARILFYRSEDLGNQFLAVCPPLLLLNLLIIAGCLFFWCKKRERPGLCVLLPCAWIALALLPALILSERPRRLAYLAIPGWSLIMGQALYFLHKKARPLPARTGVSLYILMLAATLHWRTMDWYAAGALERSLPEVVDQNCEELVFDVPNLLGDALFFSSASTKHWLSVHAPNSDPAFYTPIGLAFLQRQVATGCYYRFVDGAVRPVTVADQHPIFTRGRNWVRTP
jgi:hypothetical protein